MVTGRRKRKGEKGAVRYLLSLFGEAAPCSQQTAQYCGTFGSMRSAQALMPPATFLTFARETRIDGELKAFQFPGGFHSADVLRVLEHVLVFDCKRVLPCVI